MQKIAKKLIGMADCSDDCLLIEKFSFGREKENELLFFLKPECFFYGTDTFEKIINIISDKCAKFDIEISGVILLDGKYINKIRVMDKHYGFINTLSKNASKIVTDAEKKNIRNALNIKDNINEYLFLGGHEFLNTFGKYDNKSLDLLWASEKSEKIRSGYYVRKIEIEDKKIVLINGFHPLQLHHFIAPDHKIILFLLHSDTDWKILKEDFAGDTFPEKANGFSIRGVLFEEKDNLGIKDVSIANNFVHLSAGPFEAFFEIDNFSGKIESVNYTPSMTNMYKKMAEAGIKNTEIVEVIKNFVVKKDDSETDLFTLTENKNALDALSIYLQLKK